MNRWANDGLYGSEQADDATVFVNVDLLSGGNLGQTGHGHDVAGQRNDKACAGRDLQVANGDGKVLGRAQQGLIVGEGILRLGHADRQGGKTKVRELLRLLLGAGGQHNVLAVIDLGDNGLKLFFNGQLVFISIAEVACGIALAQPDDFFGQLHAAVAALAPDLGQCNIHAQLLALGADQRGSG